MVCDPRMAMWHYTWPIRVRSEATAGKPCQALTLYTSLAHPDVNKLVSIRGMVIRTSQIVPDMRIGV